VWRSILLKVLNGAKNIQSPFHPHGVMKSLFVIVLKESREGFLWIWCSETHRGINISRMVIPTNVDAVNSESSPSLNLPNIEFEDPNEVEGDCNRTIIISENCC
jgi:hypothetical protein